MTGIIASIHIWCLYVLRFCTDTQVKVFQVFSREQQTNSNMFRLDTTQTTAKTFQTPNLINHFKSEILEESKAASTSKKEKISSKTLLSIH